MPAALPASLSEEARAFYDTEAFDLDAADACSETGARQLRRNAAEAFEPLLGQVDTPRVLAGSLAGLPGCWIETGSADPPGPAMLYLHGGAYVLGSARMSAPLTVAICRAAGIPAWSLDYRLAPEHPCPAAIDDALASYRALLEQGRAPGEIVVCGDSAGGGLALAMLLAARDAGLPMPAAAGLISPWTDLAGSGDSRLTCASFDPVFPDPAALDRCAQAYAGRRPLTDPAVSPLFAGLHGLPPLMVQAGSREILLSDSTRLARQAQAAGVGVRLEVWDGLFHVFQILPGLPEAARATAALGGFLAGMLRGSD